MEYRIGKGRTVRSSIYPSIDNNYEKLVIEGGSIIYGDVYGRTVEVGPSTLIYGSIHADKLHIKGPVVVKGHLSGLRIEASEAAVGGSVMAVEGINLVDSLILGSATAPRIIANGSIVLGLLQTPPTKTGSYLEARASMTHALLSMGDLVVDEAYICLPAIQARGRIRAEGRILVTEPRSCGSITEKGRRLVEEIISSGRPPEKLASIPEMIGRLDIVYTVNPEEFAEIKDNPGGLIILLNREVIYSESRKIMEYMEELRSIF